MALAMKMLKTGRLTPPALAQKQKLEQPRSGRFPAMYSE
jgi:hypothetical protein